MCRNPDISGSWLGIFAKEPLPGKVKTRLSPPLTLNEAAHLYEASLRETVAAMTSPGLSFRVILCPAGDTAWFRGEFPDLPILPQGEGKLGERMARVLRTLLSGGAESAALIGSDSPDLPAALVEKAFTSLTEAEAVFSPAADGGYVLVGESRHSPELFRDIPWSTASVMEITRRRAEEAGIVWRETEGWEDVDDLSSLRRLIDRSPHSATARLARLFIAPGADFPPAPAEAAGRSRG